MTQQRLNDLAVCYVQKTLLDTLDNKNIARAFISNSDTRKNKFGTV